MMVADEGSEEWCHLKMDILTAKRHFQDALKVSNQWLKKVYNGTHEKAYAAFYRSMVYENLHNHDLTCYWFGISAIEDIRSGVMSQASLLFLAERLVEDGDYERAMRYMEFSLSILICVPISLIRSSMSLRRMERLLNNRCIRSSSVQVSWY